MDRPPMPDEIVIKLDSKPLPGWPCPNCGGGGYLADGSMSWGPDEIRIKPASKCFLCKGKGRVNVTPLEE